MEEIKRIKEIMNIREDKSPRTAPIDTKNLISIIFMTIDEFSSTVNFNDLTPDSDFINDITDNLKYLGEKWSWELLDYIFAFCKENATLLSNKNNNHEEYIIPQKKNFMWLADEQFVAKVSDTYKGKEQSYSMEFLKMSFGNLDFDYFEPYYGENIGHEYIDTWDTEWVLRRIEEIPMNEQICNNLRNLQNLFE